MMHLDPPTVPIARVSTSRETEWVPSMILVGAGILVTAALFVWGFTSDFDKVTSGPLTSGPLVSSPSSGVVEVPR